MAQLTVSAWLHFARSQGYDADAVETLLLFSRTADAFHERLERLFVHLGFSEGKFSLLMLFHTHPEYHDTGMTPAQLAAKLHVSRAAVTGLVDGLEKHALIRRIPNTQDRRSFFVQITPEGRQRVTELAHQYFTLLAMFGHTLAPASHQAFSTALPDLYAVTTNS